MHELLFLPSLVSLARKRLVIDVIVLVKNIYFCKKKYQYNRNTKTAKKLKIYSASTLLTEREKITGKKN